MKKYMDYEVKGIRPRGWPKKNWRVVWEKTAKSDSCTNGCCEW